MPKYRVHLQTGASMSVFVEADDPEAAIEAAYDHGQYLCAQCSGWGQEWDLDLGEWGTENLDGSQPPIEEIVDEEGA